MKLEWRYDQQYETWDLCDDRGWVGFVTTEHSHCALTDHEGVPFMVSAGRVSNYDDLAFGPFDSLEDAKAWLLAIVTLESKT